MDFKLTEEQQMVKEMCRKFADNELAPKAAEYDKTHAFPWEHVKKLGEMGMMGVVYPEEYNGAGMDYVSYAIAVEELSRGCASTGVIVSAHNSLCLSPIFYFGTDDQKKKYLSKLCTGEWIGCFGLTEPSAGSDAAGTKTTAELKNGKWVLNGTKNFITNGGVASRRYRVTFRGPGGHSFGAFGLVSPAFAMAGAVARLSRFQVPKNPKTTFNVGVYGGGTSVNSIPVATWMEVDMRSESPAELARLEEQFLAAVKEAVEEENRVRSREHGPIVADPKLVGDRKGGQTPATSPIVQTAVAVTRVLGRAPSLHYGSTDSNIPISLGIPAITIGSGGRAGRPHSLDEWVDVDKASTLPGMERALLIALALVGVE